MEWRRKLCWVALVAVLLICVGLFWHRAQKKERPHADAVLAAEEFPGGEDDGGYPLSEN